MPLNVYKRNLIEEALKRKNTITIFYQKSNGDRIRREIEPYEVKKEKTSKGIKEFLYGHDISATTLPSDQTIKRFDTDRLGVIIVNEQKEFIPRY